MFELQNFGPDPLRSDPLDFLDKVGFKDFHQSCMWRRQRITNINVAPDSKPPTKGMPPGRTLVACMFQFMKLGAVKLLTCLCYWEFVSSTHLSL
jgi:hypothetical protein